MDEIQLKLNAKGHGAFYIMDGGETIAEMVISISGHHITVYHTEVFPKGEGLGLGKKLLAEMVSYARKNRLKVIALCPFVNAQFQQHEAEYKDIWEQEESY